MRIAVNTRFLLGDQMEGIGRYTHQLLSRLVAMRPNDEFLFCFDRPFSKQFIYADNVKGIVVSPPARHPFLWYAWFEWSLPRALKKWKPDVFLSPDGYLSLQSSVPSLLVIHDLAYAHFPEQVPFLVRKYYEHYLPRFAQHATQLITVSDYSRRDMVSKLLTGDKKITVIGNGPPGHWQPLSSDKQDEVRAKWTNGQPYFCALGAIHPRKNIGGLIRGFNAFKKQSGKAHQLIIIGRMAWQTEAVKKAIGESEFEDAIHCVGYQPDEAVREILGSSSALLFLSLFEGFGVPMIEAMQMGVPLVYSKLSAIPEVAGGAGVGVDPTRPNDVAAGIIQVLDPTRQAEYRQAAEKQLAKYDWDHSAKKLNVLIEEVYEKSQV